MLDATLSTIKTTSEEKWFASPTVEKKVDPRCKSDPQLQNRMVNRIGNQCRLLGASLFRRLSVDLNASSATTSSSQPCSFASWLTAKAQTRPMVGLCLADGARRLICTIRAPDAELARVPRVRCRPSQPLGIWERCSLCCCSCNISLTRHSHVVSKKDNVNVFDWRQEQRPAHVSGGPSAKVNDVFHLTCRAKHVMPVHSERDCHCHCPSLSLSLSLR